MQKNRMETLIALSTAEPAEDSQSSHGQLVQLVQRATNPMNDWSRRVLASAERKAAKQLWAASTSLGRVAHRLDAAGLALSVRGERTRPGARHAGDERPVSGSAGLLDDEVCSPHLA